jgi:hypothetical protein
MDDDDVIIIVTICTLLLDSTPNNNSTEASELPLAEVLQVSDRALIKKLTHLHKCHFLLYWLKD